MFEEDRSIAAIATNPKAAKILQPLCHHRGITLWLPEKIANYIDIDSAQFYQVSLKEHLASIWQENQGFIFCLAAGAVVRLIAPLLRDKASDPAVVVLDNEGKFVISLASGHQGGADKLTQLVAGEIGAKPVITGASMSLELPGIDVLGNPFGWRKGEGNWTGVSAAIARQDVVQVIQDAGSRLWQNCLPERHSFYFGFPEYTATQKEASITPKARVWISATKRKFASDGEVPKVQWHPRVLWVGIGCERGTSLEVIAQGIKQVLQKYHLAEAAIAGISTIDVKADETAILELCADCNLPLFTFGAETLRKIKVPTPSAVVAKEVGTPSVAEAAALYVAESYCEKQLPNLLVDKQIFRLENEPGACTIAVAEAELEYTGRLGKLFLVGMGPGNLAQMTFAAQTAITQADVVIGYELYLKLIASLRRPGQIIEAFPITQEKQRAERARSLAQWGLKVAVVSSGDCGIYGMAGLVLEQLQVTGWDGKTPQVEVFPGISALQAAAAKVGAPLMHDFCAISLSDLLTPWDVIVKRLAAAAQADFVTALYNPRSRNRTQQIIAARDIFLQYRDPETPVAIVHSAYRDDEKIFLTTLDKMLQLPIDMLTTVIIGNCSSCQYGDWMITPRGYLGFE